MKRGYNIIGRKSGAPVLLFTDDGIQPFHILPDSFCYKGNIFKTLVTIPVSTGNQRCLFLIPLIGIDFIPGRYLPHHAAVSDKIDDAARTACDR